MAHYFFNVLDTAKPQSQTTLPLLLCIFHSRSHVGESMTDHDHPGFSLLYPIKHSYHVAWLKTSYNAINYVWEFWSCNTNNDLLGNTNVHSKSHLCESMILAHGSWLWSSWFFSVISLTKHSRHFARLKISYLKCVVTNLKSNHVMHTMIHVETKLFIPTFTAIHIQNNMASHGQPGFSLLCIASQTKDSHHVTRLKTSSLIVLKYVVTILAIY